ncbi:hypothetical protein BKA83DRAFT_4483841 [Pisolithus microcarpus]|nr:hypothetical protein BKA83DRAFT_4483841 [Pisolithus microcarpus]
MAAFDSPLPHKKHRHRTPRQPSKPPRQRKLDPKWPDECTSALEVPDKTSQYIDDEVIIQRVRPEGVDLEKLDFCTYEPGTAEVHWTYLDTIAYLQNPLIDRPAQIQDATTVRAKLGHMQTLSDMEETYLEHGMALPSLHASEMMQTDSLKRWIKLCLGMSRDLREEFFQRGFYSLERLSRDV